MNTPRRLYRRASLPLVAALALFFGGGCADETDSDRAPRPIAVSPAPENDLPEPHDVCEDGEPVPGCPCAEEDEGVLASCGRVEFEIAGQKTCGNGLTVCDDGIWSECIINNAATPAIDED